MLSHKLNTKMITLFFIIFSFSGNISPAYAESIKAPVYNINIYNINKYNNKYIYNKLSIINKEEQKNSSAFILARKKAIFNKKVSSLMNAVKWHESRGNYKARSRYSSACGAYQYIRSTWNNYMGYKTACVAPKWVQDKRMKEEILFLWEKYHDWEKVTAGHYTPGWAGNKAKWHRTPNGGGNKSVWAYVNSVMRKAGMK